MDTPNLQCFLDHAFVSWNTENESSSQVVDGCGGQVAVAFRLVIREDPKFYGS